MSAARDEIARLHRARPRSRFVRASLLVVLLVVALSWTRVTVRSGGFLTARRMENVERFLTEIRPWPLRDRSFDLGIAVRWAADYVGEVGGSAMIATLAISVAAAVLAGLLGLLLSFHGARNFIHPEPFAPGPRPPGAAVRFAFGATTSLVRSFCVLVRALPEYIWAFLLLAILGPSPWAAVIALALHNSGILGRLTAESIENVPRPTPAAHRLLGATRAQIAAAALFPAVIPRFLLYFFYRFETCVREATVLGMLGIVSLGYYIEDARARNHYDEMLLLVLLSAALVLLADALSTLSRRTQA